MFISIPREGVFGIGGEQSTFGRYRVCGRFSPRYNLKLATSPQFARANYSLEPLPRVQHRAMRELEQFIENFLSRRGIDVIVVERTEVAAAASGKAGGFLALDWCVGTPLDALARRSFLLHAELPNVVAGDWGYRRMTAYSGFVVPERDARRHAPAKLNWLSDGVIIASRLGTTDTTAIVHPRAFTAAMMSAAQGHGAELRHGRVTGIVRRADGSTVRGVEVDGGVIESDAVVVAMGPWSQMAAEWMVLPAVFGLRSPSLV